MSPTDSVPSVTEEFSWAECCCAVVDEVERQVEEVSRGGGGGLVAPSGGDIVAKSENRASISLQFQVTSVSGTVNNRTSTLLKHCSEIG